MGGRERRGGGEWEAKRGVGRGWGEQAWGVWHRASEDIRRLDLDLPGREKSPRRKVSEDVRVVRCRRGRVAIGRVDAIGENL